MSAAKSVVPYVNITAQSGDEYQLKGVSDPDLFGKMGGRGFPYVTLVSADGEVVWEIHLSDKAGFGEALGHARLLMELKSKAAAAPKDEGIAASFKVLDQLGRTQRKALLNEKEMAKLVSNGGVDARVVAYYKRLEIEKEAEKRIMAAFAKIRNDGGVAVLELFKKNEPIQEHMQVPFYFWAAKGAVKTKDAANAQRAFDLFIKLGSKEEGFIKQAKSEISTLKEEIKKISSGK